MGPKAEEAIAAMLNCFPQTSQNYALLLATLDKLCAGKSDRAIIEAAERYAGGKVHNQSLTFAPSGPEFVKEVERRQEFIDLRERPRLTRPVTAPNRNGLAPFEVAKQQAWNRYGHRPVLFEDVSFERFKVLSGTREIPVGSNWVPCLGIVFGPEAKQETQAA